MIFLFLIPIFASAITGAVFVVLSPARPGWKWAAVAVFTLAAYLQFYSRHVLAGLLLQIGLALALLVWRRFDAGR